MTDELKIDGHKIHYHPGRLAAWLKGENIYPLYVEIALTNTCNHNCLFCALDYVEHKGKTFDTEVLCDALNDMGRNGVKAVMFSGEGEPLLHKDWPLLVNHAKESGLDVSITCNGVLFSPEKADVCLPALSWIKFSIDAGAPETYARIHGTHPGDFEKVMDNLQHAVTARNANGLMVKIGTQLLLLEENAAEAVSLAKRVKEIGVDYLALKPYSQHPESINRIDISYDTFDNLETELRSLNSENFQVIYRSETMKRLVTGVSYPQCYGLPFFALIDSGGNIIPCNLYYGKKDYYYGNLYESTFSEIWTGSKRQEVLNRMRCNGTTDCRESCRLDSINRYLFALKNPPDHVNFI